jgi:hypothetical protein
MKSLVDELVRTLDVWGDDDFLVVLNDRWGVPEGSPCVKISTNASY